MRDGLADHECDGETRALMVGRQLKLSQWNAGIGDSALQSCTPPTSCARGDLPPQCTVCTLAASAISLGSLLTTLALLTVAHAQLPPENAAQLHGGNRNRFDDCGIFSDRG